MRDFIDNLFSSGQFMSHGHCYLWDPGLVRLHLFSDLSIGIAYVAISLVLVHLVYRARRDIPFHWVVLAFGAFIIACGGTHFMEVWTIWTPVYWLSGGVKLTTAVASVATAIVLPPLVPKALRMIQDAKLSNERQRKLEVAHSELERLYQEVKRVDALKTQFFANVSHELRTPVALIMGPVERLMEAEELSPRQRKSLQVVQSNAQTLLNYINDLLDVAKLESGQEQLRETSIDLAQILRETAGHFHSLATERGIALSVETEKTLQVLADADKLQRVFLNLLSNAFKYAPDGGVIQCRQWTDGDRIFTTVKDNGPGVPAELRSAIFERFRQGDKPATELLGGTGLGLAISKEFTELHGGSIHVTGAADGGALFTVELPFRPAPVLDLDLAVPAQPSAESRRLTRYAVETLRTQSASFQEHVTELEESTLDDRPLVLIVEDHPEMSNLIGGILAGPYRTSFAGDGEEGLRKAEAEKPDLIVSDIMMPKKNGGEMIRELRKRPEFQETPVVVLTAKADEALRLELLDGLVQDYVTKPVRPGELRARVKNLIVLRQREQALLQSQGELRKLAARLVSAQEDERSRLARDLHDGLNQWLAALTLEIGALQDRLDEPPEEIRAEIAKIEQKIMNISDEIRRMSHRLHPVSLEHVGLVGALRSHCQEFGEQTGIRTVFRARESIEVPIDLATCLFRITQEALANVAKHSEAQEVEISLSGGPEGIRLSIADTGKGFSATRAESKGGLGLVSMNERCRSLGGTLAVRSLPDQGTVVEARIPLPAEEPQAPIV